MKIIVGLGNPGVKYETTRHNAGFLAIDRMMEDWKAAPPARQYDGEIAQATVAGEKVLLVKPQTFMNVSGKCIAPLARFYKVAPEDIVAIHDDLDLKSMALRIKTGGGTGGHNGLKSLDAHLGADSTGYHRIRVGIGRPQPNITGHVVSTVDYVLQPFTDEELGRLDRVLDDITRATELIIRGEIKRAMNEYNVDREGRSEK